MRILCVSAFFETHGGGVEVVAGELARALGRRGHDCRLTGAGFDPPPGLTDVTPIPLSGSDPIEALTGLPMPLLDREGRKCLEVEVRMADAVIVHDALYLASQLARRYAIRHRKPWVIIQHIGMIPFPNPAVRQVMALANRLVTRSTLESAPQVVFISDVVRRHFEGLAFAAPPRVLYNGVDADVFHPPDPSQLPHIRGRFGLKADRRSILFVGRFVQRKGLAVLRELAAQRPDIELLVVGGGPIAPQDWGLENVRVFGRLPRDLLSELYGAADALVLPSVGEGFPLVIQEAMASGLPVVCGIESAAADPSASPFLTGVSVDLTDPTSTARRFARAIDRMSFQKQLAAVEHARSFYDWSVNAAWIEQRIIQLRAQA